MAKCPKCKKNIERLHVVVSERNSYVFTADEGVPFYEDADRIETNIEEWKCPECYQALEIEHDDDAGMAFLEGKIVVSASAPVPTEAPAEPTTNHTGSGRCHAKTDPSASQDPKFSKRAKSPY